MPGKFLDQVRDPACSSRRLFCSINKLEVLVNATRNVANVAVDEGILVVGDALNQEAIMTDNHKRTRPRIQKVF